MTKALSTTLSARSNGLDDIDGGPECRVYTQMRGIEQVRVGRLLQGGRGAPGIALVAPQQVGQDVLLVTVSPRACSSSDARAERALPGVATTNSFTSAPGAMTVPISRPSSTAPGGRVANWR